ncbi:hypothetical protein TNCV_2831221 [Trichonephila clavipes]|nr:hypothetical protein TNCV_2831221 [Trichonephila clavipes]
MADFGTVEIAKEQLPADLEPVNSPRLVIQLYLSSQSKADFGTVEIAKEQLPGGFRASELTQTRCGIIES